MTELLGGRLKVTTGDITKLRTDAVVNAANSSLMGGGGVDGAIHRAGGSTILKECREIRQNLYPEGLPEGEAVITSGGNLPASFVIHTVGPVWKGGINNEDRVLYNAYFNSLKLAQEKGISSVAFPAVSTGVYGFPKERAAGIAFDAVKTFVREGYDKPEEIIFIFYSPSDMETFLSAIQKD